MKARLLATLRELGPLSAVCYVLDRALARGTAGRWRLRRYLLLVQPLSFPNAARLASHSSMLVRELTTYDRETMQFPVAREVLARRLAAGARCFLMEIRGEFAGYAWFQSDRYEEDEVRCTFVPEPASTTVWDFDVHIEPKYRATRAFASLWNAAAAHLSSHGYDRTASRISAFNAASIRAHMRLGATRVGSVVFLTFGTWQILLARRAPYFHIGTASSRPPVVRVTASTSAPRRERR